jgi:hypothetical protein
MNVRLPLKTQLMWQTPLVAACSRIYYHAFSAGSLPRAMADGARGTCAFVNGKCIFIKDFQF